MHILCQRAFFWQHSADSPQPKTKAAMWASDFVDFLSFLCPTQSSQCWALCSVPSWKFLFSGTRVGGGGWRCWADLIPQGPTMDELCSYINIDFSLCAHFSIPVRQSGTGWARLRQCLLSVWDISGAVRTSGCHGSLRPRARLMTYSPNFRLAGEQQQPRCFCTVRSPLEMCIHEMHIRSVCAMHTLPAAHSVPIFWLCHVTTGGCLLSSLFQSSDPAC